MMALFINPKDHEPKRSYATVQRAMSLHTGMRLPGLSSVYTDIGYQLGDAPIVEM